MKRELENVAPELENNDLEHNASDLVREITDPEQP